MVTKLAELFPDEVLRALEGRYDPARLLTPARGLGGLSGAIAALANTTGGHALVGATLDPEAGGAVDVPGIDPKTGQEAVREALRNVDPPVDHLVGVRAVTSPSGVSLILVAVRQSPSPPHLVVPDGLILVTGLNGQRPIQSRAELDALFQRGRSERERADRQIDAMIEKLVQAHYAFYGVGFVVCTQASSAEPYLWARENVEELVEEAGEFASGWKLTADLAKVRPGEVELKGEREAHGYVRITRSGCVAVGEVRRRPPGNTIGNVDDVVRRVTQMVELGCRILAHAPSATAVPCLFYEGMRGQRIVVGEHPYAESSGLEVDMAQFPGNLGDPSDPEYRERVTADLLLRYLAGFKVDWEPEPLPTEA